MRATAGVLAVGLMSAACGVGGSDGSTGASTVDAGSGSLKTIDSLKGVTFNVGSKDFDEQLVLGQVAIATLNAVGADAVDKTNIQGTVNTRKALQSGDIDMYWGYTGTGWITFLGHTDPVKGEQEQFDATAKEDLAKNGIKWLPYAPLNDTYAIAASADVAKKFNVKTVSDLAKVPAADQTYCLESEFASRDDGFQPMTKTYGYSVPDDQIKILDTGLVYTETAKAEVCNWGEVFTTDGRIPALDLTVLEDDKNFFPKYNAAITMKDETFKKYPELADAFAPVSEALTNDEIQGMLKKVSVDGEQAVDVVEAWMKDQGFVS